MKKTLALISFAILSMAHVVLADGVPSDLEVDIDCYNGGNPGPPHFETQTGDTLTTKTVTFGIYGAYSPEGVPNYSIQIPPGACSNFPQGKTLLYYPNGGQPPGVDGAGIVEPCDVQASFSFIFTGWSYQGCTGLGQGHITLVQQ